MNGQSSLGRKASITQVALPFVLLRLGGDRERAPSRNEPFIKAKLEDLLLCDGCTILLTGVCRPLQATFPGGVNGDEGDPCLEIIGSRSKRHIVVLAKPIEGGLAICNPRPWNVSVGLEQVPEGCWAVLSQAAEVSQTGDLYCMPWRQDTSEGTRSIHVQVERVNTPEFASNHQTEGFAERATCPTRWV